MQLADIAPNVQGRVGLWRVNAAGLWVPTHSQHNQIQYSWGYIAAQAIGRRKSDFGIAALYIEFENVADPDDPVTIPSFAREDGLSYYSDLMSSGTRDFLRVPLLSDPLLAVSDGYEDFFSGDEGNVAKFFAQTVGLTGVHGKTFSDSVNSKICGAVLVATPVVADWTRDVIFARTYFDTDEQEVKEASTQIGVSWEISFL